MKIGVLEDDPKICGLLKEMLELEGHDVSIYRDGWALLEDLLGEDPASLLKTFDVLVIDLLLPGTLSGWQVIREVRGRDPDMHIVIITALTAKDIENVQRHYPGVKALQKPFRLADLFAVIQS
jgi:DNA-binding response OmpR family regulator